MTTASPADGSVMSNASAKTAAETAIRLKTAQKDVIVSKSQLVTVNVKKE